MSNGSIRGWLKWSAISGMVAPVLFTILYLVLGLITPSYDAYARTISELGQTGQQYALVQDANFLVTGLLIIVFVAGLRSSIGHSQISRLGSVLLLAYPLAFVLVGTAFPLPSPVHVPLGSASFFVTLVGMIVISRPMRFESSWKQAAWITLVTGISSVVGFFVYGFLQSQGVLTNWLGLAQRLELAPYFAWNEFIAVRFARLIKGSRKLPSE